MITKTLPVPIQGQPVVPKQGSRALAQLRELDQDLGGGRVEDTAWTVLSRQSHDGMVVCSVNVDDGQHGISLLWVLEKDLMYIDPTPLRGAA